MRVAMDCAKAWQKTANISRKGNHCVGMLAFGAMPTGTRITSRPSENVMTKVKDIFCVLFMIIALSTINCRVSHIRHNV